jgi:hypothetical protein
MDVGSTIGNGTDILLFPQQIRYKNLKIEDIDKVIDDLIKGRPANGLTVEPITSQYVFICCHKNRDLRCGSCGPVLVDGFSTELERRGITDEIVVRQCSHVSDVFVKR